MSVSNISSISSAVGATGALLSAFRQGVKALPWDEASSLRALHTSLLALIEGTPHASSGRRSTPASPLRGCLGAVRTLAESQSVSLGAALCNLVAEARREDLSLWRIAARAWVLRSPDKTLRDAARTCLAAIQPPKAPDLIYLEKLACRPSRPTTEVLRVLLDDSPIRLALALACNAEVHSTSGLFKVLTNSNDPSTFGKLDKLLPALVRFVDRQKLRPSIGRKTFQILAEPWRIAILAHLENRQAFLENRFRLSLEKTPYLNSDTPESLALAKRIGTAEESISSAMLSDPALLLIFSDQHARDALANRIHASLDKLLIKSARSACCERGEYSGGPSLAALVTACASAPQSNIHHLALAGAALSSRRHPDQRLLSPSDTARLSRKLSDKLLCLLLRNADGLFQQDLLEAIAPRHRSRLVGRCWQSLAGPFVSTRSLDLAFGTSKTKRFRESVTIAAADIPTLAALALSGGKTVSSRIAALLVSNPQKPIVDFTRQLPLEFFQRLESGGESIAKALASCVASNQEAFDTFLRLVSNRTAVFAIRVAAHGYVNRRQFSAFLTTSYFPELALDIQKSVLQLQSPRKRPCLFEFLANRKTPPLVVYEHPELASIAFEAAPLRVFPLTQRLLALPQVLVKAADTPRLGRLVARTFSKEEISSALPDALAQLRGTPRRSAALEVAALTGLGHMPLLLLVAQRVGKAASSETFGKRLDDLYRNYKLPKRSGGNRMINAPKYSLKRLQRALLPLLESAPLSEAAVGFRKGHSIKDGAKRHVGRKIVVNIDIRNFFPSTGYILALRAWRRASSNRLSPRALRLVSELACYGGHLATGAPTSPALANIVLTPIDRALETIAGRLGVAYSRYADDLTFSGSSAAVWMIKPATSLLAKLDYAIDDKKTNIFRAGRRQVVTGLVVNHKVNLARPLRRRLRAAVHMRVAGKAPHWRGAPLTDDQLRGHLGHLAMVAPQEAAALARKLSLAPGWRK